MYTFDSPILYPEATRGECISGQHTDCFHILLAVLSKRRADRFFLWWLFLHRRLRSRQRGSFCNERLSCFSAVPFQKVSFVFIRTTRKVLRLFSASLSASMQGVNSNCFPSFAALKQCVTASVCLSLLRSNARRNFDLWKDFIPVFSLVKENLL